MANSFTTNFQAALSEIPLCLAAGITLNLLMVSNDTALIHDAVMLVLGGLFGAYQASRQGAKSVATDSDGATATTQVAA